MTCGIYLLKFYSGKVYIGQSVDIEARWAQHFKDFRFYRAAKCLQNEWNKFGDPETFVLLECHKDFLNTLETASIHNYPKDICLNTTTPFNELSRLSPAQIEKILEYRHCSLIDITLALQTS
jgi:hypothetical protein